jgi:hypothetical protein
VPSTVAQVASQAHAPAPAPLSVPSTPIPRPVFTPAASAREVDDKLRALERRTSVDAGSSTLERLSVARSELARSKARA